MPEYATTSLIEYIGLRLLKILSFYTIISLTVNFVMKKNIDYVIKLIAYIGVFISLLSLYSYFSYVFDWTDFSRTRAGTGGWAQPIRRACSILRNYGTFREPSFLAVWSAPIIPLIFYLARKSKTWYIISLIPILSLVLTRSLTGIISVIIVFLIAILFANSVNASILSFVFSIEINFYEIIANITFTLQFNIRSTALTNE